MRKKHANQSTQIDFPFIRGVSFRQLPAKSTDADPGGGDTIPITAFRSNSSPGDLPTDPGRENVSGICDEQRINGNLDDDPNDVANPSSPGAA